MFLQRNILKNSNNAILISHLAFTKAIFWINSIFKHDRMSDFRGESLNEPNTLQNFYDSLGMKATKPLFPLLEAKVQKLEQGHL